MFLVSTEMNAFNKIKPDFIYNRKDLFAEDYEILKINDCDNTYYIEVEYKDNVAFLGLWLNSVCKEAVEAAVEYIFNNRRNISQISYEYSYIEIGLSYQKNHFKIDLPETEEELQNRLSSKGRYNIKREKKILERDFGSYFFSEYTSESVPDSIIEVYFEMKQKTHGVDYHMSAKEYLSHYHVTNIYALFVGDVISAIIHSCEQCEFVYIENIAYDLNYAKYSPGQIIYDLYLKRLIEKGRKFLFLAGGNLDYKKRYGSIEEVTYNATVYRHRSEELFHRMKQATKKLIRK